MSASGSNDGARANALYRELNHRQDELVVQGIADHLLRREIKGRKAVIDAELEQMRAKIKKEDCQKLAIGAYTLYANYPSYDDIATCEQRSFFHG
jgi:hypothetical protein